MKGGMKYLLRERTPEAMRCIVGSCPAIYTANNSELRYCGIGACPDIQEKGNVYLIIGKLVDAKPLGLEKKVGEGEVLIEVPKVLIDDMRRE
jgi:hypothetical protein